jgi:ABC-type transporter lipoprotein component MlaA
MNEENGIVADPVSAGYRHYVPSSIQIELTIDKPGNLIN